MSQTDQTAQFHVVAVAEDGALKDEHVSATSARDLIERLRQEGWTVLSARRADQKAPARPGRVGAEDLALFNEELAQVAQSKVPLPTALAMLARDTRSRRLRDALGRTRERIARGDDIADAFAEDGRAFPPLYVALLRAGIEAGNLPATLLALARHSTARLRLRARMIESAIYPSVLVLSAFALLCFVFTVGMPRLAMMYTDVDASASEAWWLSTMAFVRGASGLIAVALIVIGLTCLTYRGRLILAAVTSRLPGFRGFALAEAWSYALHTLATLFEVHVSAPRALRLVAEAMARVGVRRDIEEAAPDVERGDALSDALERRPRVPRDIVWAVRAGEAEGKLPDVLRSLAESYTSEATQRCDRLEVVIPMIVLLGMGLLVFAVVFVVLYPMIDLLSTL